jgi:threonylcarbamoyladenosine tRNA methylthiotransferase MtaB
MPRRLRVYTSSLGCKVSQVEAASSARALGEPLASPGSADVVLVQACSVTDRAERDARRLIRRLARENPAAMIVVTGCLAQRDPSGVAALAGVDVVVRQEDRARLPSIVDEERARRSGCGPPVRRAPCGDWTALPEVLAEEGRTRAFLKIQDGCEQRCSFCVVPLLRGRERSARISDVETECRRLSDLGVPEVVLAGTHLSGFGSDRREGLLDLLERFERRPPACRVRISSLEPMTAGADLLAAVASSSVVVPHLHLPLQSGSNSVLRRMRRGITRERFARLVTAAASLNSRLHVATDLIAGFPGETEAEFEETLRLVEALPLASLHVFPFSPRSRTEGARLHAISGLGSAVVTTRASLLRQAGARKLATFTARSEGGVADVVALHGGRGLTDNYIEVSLDGDGTPPGRRFLARLTGREAVDLLVAVPLARHLELEKRQPVPPLINSDL